MDQVDLLNTDIWRYIRGLQLRKSFTYEGR